MVLNQICAFLNEQFSRINLLTSLNLLKTESLPKFACYFNKFSLGLLLILLAFILKFHSYIMVIERGGQIEREKERERERERLTRNPSFFYGFVLACVKLHFWGDFGVFFFCKFRSSSSNSKVFPEIKSQKSNFILHYFW